MTVGPSTPTARMSPSRAPATGRPKLSVQRGRRGSGRRAPDRPRSCRAGRGASAPATNGRGSGRPSRQVRADGDDDRQQDAGDFRGCSTAAPSPRARLIHMPRERERRVALERHPDERDQHDRFGRDRGRPHVGRRLDRARRAGATAAAPPRAPKVAPARPGRTTGISTRAQRAGTASRSARRRALKCTGSRSGSDGYCSSRNAAVAHDRRARMASAAACVAGVGGNRGGPCTVTTPRRAQHARRRPPRDRTPRRSAPTMRVLDLARELAVHPSRSQRRDAAVGDAARHDQREVVRSVVTLQREAVAGDPARDADADGRQLLVADPDAGQSRDASARRCRNRRRPDQHLFEVAHVPVHVAAIGLEIDDRVADDLAGPVIGDVAAAPGLEHLDAARGQVVVGRENVRPAAVAAHAEREDGRMLDQQQQIADRAGAPLLDERALQRERVGVRHQAEAPDLEGSHRIRSIGRPADAARLGSSDARRSRCSASGLSGSQFSSCCLMCAMNWSATAPSMRRWSKPSVRYAIGRIAIASSMTTARFSMAPTPRMPTCGWLMIGMPNCAPKTPGFVIVNVPPGTSSGLSCLARARSARSAIALLRPSRFFSSAFLMTGTISPQSSATAMPTLTCR